MPARPSEPLLTFLREAIRRKGLSTVALAEKLGRNRSELKRALSGVEPMTLDDLVMLSQALELTPAELGMGGASDAPTVPEVVPLRRRSPRPVDEDDSQDEGQDDDAERGVVRPFGVSKAPEEEDAPATDEVAGPDPLGNLAQQALRFGYGLGVDVFLVLDAKQLRDSGVPRPVLQRFPEQFPVKLEARVHRLQRPVFGEDAFEVLLSFDRLYPCVFPWTAFRQVAYTIPEEAPAPPKPEAPTRPTLRVVK